MTKRTPSKKPSASTRRPTPAPKAKRRTTPRRTKAVAASAPAPYPSGGMPWALRTAASAAQHDFGMFTDRVEPAMARQILRSATTGDLAAQHELFGIMEDSWERLAKNLNEVKNAVRRLPWSVTAYAGRDEVATPEAMDRADLVDRCLKNWLPRRGTLERSFEDTLYDVLDAFGKGTGVVEIHWDLVRSGPNGSTPVNGFEWRPRAGHAVTPKQYGWNQSRTALGLYGTDPALALDSRRDYYGSQLRTWSPFPEDNFLVGIWGARTGAPGATALLRPLVPYWFGATYGWRWLLETAELFGVPFRWGTYNADQPQVGDQLLEMLRTLGSAGYAAFPEGTKIDFQAPITNAEGNPQSLILALAKQACDIVILGQDSSTEAKTTGLGDGTSKLQGRVRDEVLKHASWWVADIINYQLIPSILRLNYGDAEMAPTVSPDLSTDPDPKALAERDAILRTQLGMQLPLDWLHDRHQVPSVAPTGNQPAAGSNQAGPGTNEPKPGDGEDTAQTGSTAADPEDGDPSVNAASSADPGAESDHQVLPAVVEEIVTAAVAESVGARRRWLEPVREELDALIARAQSGQITDADLATFAEAAARSMPDLFARMDVNALADSLTAAMGTAAVAGATKG